MPDTGAYVLDNSFIIQRYHPDVYLMTETEIHRFFKECDQYVLRKRVPGRAYVFPALYRFMYCCGVRSAEARQLKCRDVHLDRSYVDILWAKAHRDRRLFLSEERTPPFLRVNEEVPECVSSCGKRSQYPSASHKAS